MDDCSILLLRESPLASRRAGVRAPTIAGILSRIYTFAMTRYQAGENLSYFCTITVLDWVPVFIDERYIEPLMGSITFCRTNKGMQLFAYVVMPHHVHLNAAADDLHALFRDFKRFTSRTIHEHHVADGRESILAWLDRAAQDARRQRGEFSFWQDGFHPQEIHTRAMFDQKLRYIHENPVRKGLVPCAEDWRYSSASWYAEESEFRMEMDQWEF